MAAAAISYGSSDIISIVQPCIALQLVLDFDEPALWACEAVISRREPQAADYLASLGRTLASFGLPQASGYDYYVEESIAKFGGQQDDA